MYPHAHSPAPRARMNVKNVSHDNDGTSLHLSPLATSMSTGSSLDRFLKSANRHHVVKELKLNGPDATSDDHTEGTATETEWADSSSCASFHSYSPGWSPQRSPSHQASPTRSSKRGLPLRVVPHHLCLFEEEDEEECETKAVSIPDLVHHQLLGEGFFGQVWLVSNATESENESESVSESDSTSESDSDSETTLTSTDPSITMKFKTTGTATKNASPNQKTEKQKPSTPATPVYALKKMSKYHLLCEDQVENTVREKHILQSVHHPGIVSLVASYQDTEFLYLLLPFLRGGELFSLVHQQHAQTSSPTDGAAGISSSSSSNITESGAQFYVTCLADALWYLHVTCRIVYRDLKLENIMIDEQGYPVLVDFGFARYLSLEEDGSGSSSKAYTMCGSPKYLSPELINGDGYSFECDYWALGVVLYEMLTHGQHPFELWPDMDNLALFASITDEEYLALPESISADARDMVHRLLNKDLTERLGTTETTDHSDIMQHPFLSQSGDRSVPLLRRKLVPAPWIPKVRGGLDAQYFDAFSPDSNGDEDLFLVSAHLSEREQERFAEF